MGAMPSQITGVSIVCLTVCSDADKKKPSKLSGLCEGIHRWPVDSPHKGSVTRKYSHLMTSSWKLTSSKHVYNQHSRHFADDIFPNTFLMYENCIFDSNFTGVCTLGSIWQLPRNEWRQTIIWTCDNQVYWRMFVSLGLDELTKLRITAFSPQNFLSFSTWGLISPILFDIAVQIRFCINPNFPD